MLRLIGILIGSALAIGFLIVVLGVPKFAGSDGPGPELAGTDLAATVSVPEPAVVDLPAIEPAPEPVANDLPAAEAVPDEPGDAETLAMIDRIFEPAPQEPGDAGTLAMIDETFEPAPESLEDENWYAFWSPFRSEIAANGFVSRLQETTGIDYRVVKVKTGVYEVAFAYSDETDIQDKLARISSATGLDMSGS